MVCDFLPINFFSKIHEKVCQQPENGCKYHLGTTWFPPIIELATTV